MEISFTLLDALLGILQACLVFGGCTWFYQIYRNRKLPPGPYGLPFVGYLPFLSKDKAHIELHRLAKKYGPVYSIRMGSQLVVVLASSKSIKEAHSKHELNGRPEIPFFRLINMSSPLLENGDIWRAHRKFLEKFFKTIVNGKSSVNESIMGEIQDFMNILAQQDGAAFNSRDQLLTTLCNIMTWILFGKELNKNDKNLFYKSVSGAAESFQKSSPLLFFPFVQKFFLMRNLLNHLTRDIQNLAMAVDSVIRKEILRQKQVPREFYVTNFIQTFLMKMKNNANHKNFNESTLSGTISNLFGAGVITTLTSLEWCFYLMAVLPNVQKKVQQELDDVIGRERLPEFSDQSKLPFTHSILMEVQRCYTVLPLSTPRMALEDMEFWGYKIPKRTIVMAHLYAAHHEPEHFTSPEIFMPDRFLDPITKLAKKHQNYMPFGFGKRKCPGENFANIEVFLFFTCILQQFRLHIPTTETINVEGEIAITYQLKPHKICFMRRV